MRSPLHEHPAYQAHEQAQREAGERLRTFTAEQQALYGPYREAVEEHRHACHRAALAGEPAPEPPERPHDPWPDDTLHVLRERLIEVQRSESKVLREIADDVEARAVELEREHLAKVRTLTARSGWAIVAAAQLWKKARVHRYYKRRREGLCTSEAVRMRLSLMSKAVLTFALFESPC